jgi:hypothetical protein
MEEPKPAPNEKAAPKKGSVMKTIAGWIAVLVIVVAVFYVLFVHEGPWPWEPPAAPPITVPPMPANVELYRFSDLKTNNSVNVEIWVKNIGEETAKDVSVFVRVRNQNGTVAYMDQLDLTWQILSDNESSSATYTVHYGPKDVYLESAIEVRWSTGMHSYLKKTELRP